MKKSRVLLLISICLTIMAGTFAITVLRHEKMACCAVKKIPSSLAHLQDWSRPLGLNAEQLAKLAPAESTLKTELEKLQSNLATERLNLCTALETESLNSPRIKEVLFKISELESAQQKLVTSHLMAMRDVLTETQRGKLFARLKHEICENCRAMVPGQKCVCGHCDIQ